MSAVKKKYTSGDLVDMIRTKYSGNAFTVLEQVADGTGAGASSWVDAAVFSLWPSNGIWRSACEVKVTRADFLKELSQPNKNQWAREHFDFFWYVVAPDVAKDDEIPEGTGLMVVRGDALTIKKQAPRRESVITDQWIVASFARSLDKEREKIRNTSRRQLIESDYDYKRYKIAYEAVDKYLTHCGKHAYGHESVSDLFDTLLKCRDDQAMQLVEAEQINGCLGKFQESVMDFILEIAPLADAILTARDETGKFVLSRYGRKDEHSIEALKKVAKSRSKRNAPYGVDSASRTVAVRELIAERITGEPQ